MKKVRVLFKCQCGNYRFEDEDDFEMVKSKTVIDYFKKIEKAGRIEILPCICPECEKNLLESNQN